MGHSDVRLFVSIRALWELFVTERKESAPPGRFKSDGEAYQRRSRQDRRGLLRQVPRLHQGSEEALSRSPSDLRQAPWIDIGAASFAWFSSNIHPSLLEGINSHIQAARPRGCRTIGNLLTTICVIGEKLQMKLRSAFGCPDGRGRRGRLLPCAELRKGLPQESAPCTIHRGDQPGGQHPRAETIVAQLTRPRQGGIGCRGGKPRKSMEEGGKAWARTWWRR